METINELVRGLIRVPVAKVADEVVTDHIERALTYVELDTDVELEVADTSNANTDSLYFDELVAYRSAWTLYLRLYQQSVRSKDPSSGSPTVFNVYEQQYLQNLMVDYPLKVMFKSGIYAYSNPIGDGGGGSGGSTSPAREDMYILDNRPTDAGLRGDRFLEDL